MIQEILSTNNINLYKKVDIHYIVSFSGDLANAIKDPFILALFGFLILILGVGIKNYLVLNNIKSYIKKRGDK